MGLSHDLMKAHTEEVKKQVDWIKEVGAQYDSGLINAWEYANKMVEVGYKIKSECEAVGGWAIAWGKIP